jgi:hypothetical protein
MADDVAKQVAPVSDLPINTKAQTDVTVVNSESKEEKLRRAKIAMEGLDRTIRREATEKEEEASEEKQQLNKLLLSLDHEKELMELTWVNLDDKRASLKKVLEPILAEEDKIESEETNLESQEEVTVDPVARRELEQKRWQVQENRKKVEEEKWLVEEKVQKIDGQIEEIKQKYQKLLAQEEELRQKIQTIDEQMLLQQEVLRQQHDLEEQKRRQETINQVEEKKKQEEAEKRRLDEIKKADEAKTKAEEERKKAEASGQSTNQEKISEQDRLEKLRQGEEERQRQETTKQQGQQEKELELKRKIAEAIKNNGVASPLVQEKIETIAEPPTPSNGGEKSAELRRALELEQLKRENEEAEVSREKQTLSKNRSTLEEIKESTGALEPLRTLKGDLEAALKDSSISNADLARVNKKTFPWAK